MIIEPCKTLQKYKVRFKQTVIVISTVYNTPDEALLFGQLRDD